MKSVVITLTVYKSTLYNYEVLSLHSLFKTLRNKYKYRFVTYKELDVSMYEQIASKYGIIIEWVHIDKGFFEGDVNRFLKDNIIMTSRWYFELFEDYDYLFAWQLDCYLFKDEIEYWVSLDKDFFECSLFLEKPNFTDEYNVTETIAYANGQGLKKVKFFLWLLDKYELEYTKYQRDLFMQYNFVKQNGGDINEYKQKYNYFLGQEICGSDNLNTKIALKETFFWTEPYFGISNFHKEVLGYEKLKRLPMMIHYFNLDFKQSNEIGTNEWSVKYIGDWDNDLDGCINHPRFLNYVDENMKPLI